MKNAKPFYKSRTLQTGTALIVLTWLLHLFQNPDAPGVFMDFLNLIGINADAGTVDAVVKTIGLVIVMAWRFFTDQPITLTPSFTKK